MLHHNKKMNQKDIYQFYTLLWKRRNFTNKKGETIMEAFKVWNDLGVLVKRGIPVYLKLYHDKKGWRIWFTAHNRTLAEVLINHTAKRFEVAKNFSIFNY